VKKTLKSLIGIGIFVLLIYGGYKLLPTYMAAWEFEDAIKEEAKLNAYGNRSDTEIRDTLLRKAHELEIPITENQVSVRRDSGELVISADYTLHVDFAVYPFDLSFHPSSRMRRFAGLG
jgi:hypothetical protein